MAIGLIAEAAILLIFDSIETERARIYLEFFEISLSVDLASKTVSKKIKSHPNP